METQILMLVAVCGFFSGKFFLVNAFIWMGGAEGSSFSKYTSEVMNAFLN